MERFIATLSVFALGAFFVLSVAGAQQPPDPTVPEDARDEQTMVPEDAEDDVTRGEDADDTAAATADAAATPTTPAPAANQAATATRQAAAPATQAAAPAPQAAAPAFQVSTQSPVASPARVIIVPESRAAEPSTDGCWARLHAASAAPGDSVTIVGPIDMPQLRGPFGLEWDERIGSVEAGPRATVSLFGDERYEDLATTVAPGRRLASTGGEIESLRIACSRSATG